MTLIQSGLVSITFRKLTPEQIVALVSQAGQAAIEWGGDLHVPHGDVARAKEVAALTRDAGLVPAAYGSYYRVGHSEGEGLSFEAVCDTAVALGAPAIRVWAGRRKMEEVDDLYRAAVVADLRRIADLAAQAQVRIVTEYHAGTLTATDASALQLMEELDHTNVRTLWQPPNGIDPAVNLRGLQRILPWVEYFHVFQWWPAPKDRHPLSDGETSWHAYLSTLASAERNSYALMEYVPGDEPEAYLRDAKTLNHWLNNLPASE